MSKQADILRPKFEMVLKVLDDEFMGSGIAHWNSPLGGYFVSVYLYNGTAKETVRLANDDWKKILEIEQEIKQNSEHKGNET